MLESKYLARFSKLNQELLPLRGNRLLVEVLPKEENKSAGGLIIQSNMEDHRNTTEINRAELAIVLALGTGYYDDETGEEEPMDFEIGNVILISRMGLKLYSQFPALAEYTKESIALTRDSEVHAKWANAEAFELYRQALNT